jgi:hypothetical protein
MMKTIKKKTKMKKLIYSLVFASGMVLFTGATVPAQEKGPGRNRISGISGSGYTDANGDGVCDNFKGVRQGKGKGPGNGQGLGRTSGKGFGKGIGLRDGSGSVSKSGNGKQLRDGSGGNCKTPVK